MSEISKQALKVDNSTSFPNNTTGYISPTILRAFNVNMIDSLVEQEGYNDDSASWNVSIGALNTYTASFAPSLTQLNAFTASQLLINTGVNQYTQSTNAVLSNLNSYTSSINAWSSSINQIQSNGVVLGTSTRFNLVGPGTFFSASLVQNVDGTIATLTFTSDNAKVNTSSFNDYTASTAATQSVFSASVATSISASSTTFTAFSASQNNFNQSATASLVELLNLSSSLSGGYATQGELDQSASVLQANIDTVNNNLSSFTGSYATTGSNTFIGTQTISGSLLVSGSGQNDLTIVGQVFISSSVTTAAGQPRLTVSGSAGQSIINRNSISTRNTTNVAQLNPSAIFANSISTSDEIGFTVSDTTTPNWSKGPAIYVNDTDDTYPAVFGFQNKANYTDGTVTILKPLIITGSVTITGSALGNVNTLVTAANTASMDLSKANFFTLDLVSGSTTHLLANNIKPGQTINLLVTQPLVGTGSLTFNSTFKYAPGNQYTASNSSSAQDIVTFITFNTGSIYASAIKSLQ